jgi:hypothetical protein
MWVLYAKFKMQPWEEVESFPDTTTDVEKAEKLNEYKDGFGQGWMFKWEKQ